MPTTLTLPDLPIGHIVQGDVVLRNVVVDTAPATSLLPAPARPTTPLLPPINTAPSTQIKTPVPTQPATPLIPSTPVSTPSKVVSYPKKDPAPPQFASDLKIPQNLPAGAFSVFIDKKDGSIVKADMQDTPALFQQDFYFLGAFDSNTADAVIKDMIDNPIPSQSEVIDQYLNKAIPFAMGGYLSGLIIFQALKNAKENWGSFIGFDERVEESMVSQKAPTSIGRYNSYPKSAVISVAYFGSQPASQRLVEGVMIPTSLYDGELIFRGIGNVSLYWRNQPKNWSWRTQPESHSVRLITHPSKAQGGMGNYPIADRTEEKGLIDYILKLNDIQTDFVFSVKFESVAPSRPVALPPAQPSLAQLTSNISSQLTLPKDIPPQVKQLTEKYVAVNTLMQKMEARNEHFDIVNTQPLNNKELVQLYTQGKAQVQNVVNPNANKRPNDPSRLWWVLIELPDGRTTWKADPSIKTSDIRNLTKQVINNVTQEVGYLADGRMVADLSSGVVPTLVADPFIVKGEFKLAPDYVSLARISQQLGEQLGVPAGCQPNNPTILPPAVVPPNCAPQDTKNVRRFYEQDEPKIFELPAEKLPTPEPYTRGGDGGAGGGGGGAGPNFSDQSAGNVNRTPDLGLPSPTGDDRVVKWPSRDDSYKEYQPDKTSPPSNEKKEPETGGPYPRWPFDGGKNEPTSTASSSKRDPYVQKMGDKWVEIPDQWVADYIYRGGANPADFKRKSEVMPEEPPKTGPIWYT